MTLPSGFRVLVVTPFFPPGVGGSVRTMCDIIGRLVEAGAQVDVLTTSTSQEPSADDTVVRGGRVERMASSGLRGTTTLRMCSKLAGMLRRTRYDLVFCGSAQPVIYPVYAATRLFHIPYVVVALGEDLQDVDHVPAKRWLLHKSMRGASRVVVISRYTRSLAAKYSAEPGAIEMVYPGVEPASYIEVNAAAVERLRNRLGLEGRRVLLTLARLDPRKGHDTVIKAMPRILESAPDAAYLIVGKGDPTALKLLATELGVADRVVFVDYLAQDELPALFSLCDLYVMVSRADPHTGALEGFGICYVEAALCGRPCIAANVGGPTDAVADGVTGFLVDPGDSVQTAECAAALLSDSALAARMGQAGRERAVAEFRLETMLDRYCEIFSRHAHRERSARVG